MILSFRQRIIEKYNLEAKRILNPEKMDFELVKKRRKKRKSGKKKRMRRKK